MIFINIFFKNSILKTITSASANSFISGDFGKTKYINVDNAKGSVHRIKKSSKSKFHFIYWIFIFNSGAKKRRPCLSIAIISKK